jgi:hypothetical protein
MTSNLREKRLGPRRSNRKMALVGIGAIGVFAAIGLGIAVAGDDSPSASIVRTGEISAMGLPVIETPGASAGASEAGPVAVTGVSWRLGTVPLDVAVRPTWTLRNTGSEPVLVGEPHPEVRDGCCPGAFSIGTTTIAPGETTTLGFELSMHAGMDGWHDIAVHVPVRVGATDHVLELDVTGEFTNS